MPTTLPLLPLLHRLAACLTLLAALFAIGVAGAGVGAARAADTPPRLAHDAALAAIGAREPARRLQGIASLAETGGMAEARLLTGLLRDPDEDVRAAAERAMWTVWGHSGDAAIDRLYQQGVALMGDARYAEAMGLFNRIIRERPAFAEGWNKRATLYFMLGEYQLSLRDCAEVVKRNPDHFGVYAGYGQIYVNLEQFDKALEYFRKALAVNPNMTSVARNIERIEELQRERRRNMI
jgi:tetratricopeptide (TPR) repeat protein